MKISDIISTLQILVNARLNRSTILLCFAYKRGGELVRGEDERSCEESLQGSEV
jgi:hypothetical protein